MRAADQAGTRPPARALGPTAAAAPRTHRTGVRRSATVAGAAGRPFSGALGRAPAGGAGGGREEGPSSELTKSGPAPRHGPAVSTSRHRRERDPGKCGRIEGPPPPPGGSLGHPGSAPFTPHNRGAQWPRCGGVSGGPSFRDSAPLLSTSALPPATAAPHTPLPPPPRL